jgi:hypothetical protein
MNEPMFSQFPEHDEALSAWFAQQGWPVSSRYFDFHRDVFTWRHEQPSLRCTLRVTHTVLEDYAPDKLIALFDNSRLARLLETKSDKYVILRRRPSGGIGFDILDGPPADDT